MSMLSLEQIRLMARFELLGRKRPHAAEVGNYHAHSHGSGLEFDELREYSIGDDVRMIDWNSSVRTDSLLVKKYREEINRTIMVFIDGSSSLFYGSSGLVKYELAAEVAGLIVASGFYNNDSVGVMLYNDRSSQMVRPSLNPIKFVEIMNLLYGYYAQERTTASLQKALEYYMKFQKKPSLIVIISDFFDENYKHALIAARKVHDIVVLRISDSKEQYFDIPASCDLIDNESLEIISSITVGEAPYLATIIRQWYDQQTIFFKYHRMPYYDVISTRHSWEQLIQFLRNTHT